MADGGIPINGDGSDGWVKVVDKAPKEIAEPKASPHARYHAALRGDSAALEALLSTDPSWKMRYAETYGAEEATPLHAAAKSAAG
eukprot:SAG31_NODE_11794_length_997_cov_1.743875_2_plen_84_part_01